MELINLTGAKELIDLTGTILGYSGKARLSRIIKAITLSPLSHVSILAWITKGDYIRWRVEHHLDPTSAVSWIEGLYIVESTDCVNPCLFAEQPISGAQVRPMSSFLDYEGRVWAYLPKDPLDAEERSWLTDAVLKLVGTKYDWSGAALAGTRFMNMFPCFRSKLHDRNTNYCAEVVGEGVMAWSKRRMPDIDWEPGRLRPRDVSRFVKAGLYQPSIRVR
ncbi:hypothetical protein M0R72_16275 [Candidatus Pacearchaeota archaeon]|jgi:hypothetical protein|nr:hypothetical protein [Candidatus Pacearchaeota archaeon]